MIELTTARKNKICLSDYNYRKDIENRLLMARFGELEFAVLEEILFSSIKVPISKIGKNLDESEDKILPILEEFARTGLLSIEGDVLIVDKEMRKYWESQAAKFEPSFKPDIEFLFSLLRKVPIHVLPIWYSIPRTSNNIFDSIIEKYLLTPQIYQRYLLELQLGDPTLAAIVQDVFRAPTSKLDAQQLIDKYGLEREQFEEYMLHLEFNFLCCLSYEKQGAYWKEVVTPFHEWREYLSLLNTKAAKPVSDVSKVLRFRPNDYSFIQDMTAILLYLSKQSLVLNNQGYATLISLCEELSSKETFYLEKVLHKLCALKLAELNHQQLTASPFSQEWLDMRQENRALYLYRHPKHTLASVEIRDALKSEKNIREAEKALTRVLHKGWVTFDSFLEATIVPVGDHPPVTLQKQGKQWRYVVPTYNAEEKAFLKAAVFDYFFEAGITAIGSFEETDCFCVTPFGQTLFG